MKSASNSRKLRARLISIAVCAALILCTALSFCFINIKPIKTSAEETRVAETGLRFVQVAAGEDFAIGLTYDGDLYGWSLLDTDYGLNPATAKTLGQYYTKTPRQIPVIFRQGPGTSGEQRRWNNNVYHTPIDLNTSSSDATQIVEISATRTTAAFITKNGTIYTWGKDAPDFSGGYSNEVGHYLLLRNPDDSTKNPWFLPYIIDYGHFTRSYTETIPAEFQFIRPVLGNPTIAAGENNYIISFTKSGSNNFYTYVWGSLMYSTRMGTNTFCVNNEYQGPEVVNSADSGEIRLVYQTPYSSLGSDVKVRAVAGGYTVGINSNVTPSAGTTSLSLRGKNFISSIPKLTQVESTTTYTMARTAATQSKEYSYVTAESTGGSTVTKTVDGTSAIDYSVDATNKITVNGAIIGNYVSGGKNSDGTMISAAGDKEGTDNDDLVMGRLASGSAVDAPAITFTSTSGRTDSIYSAQAGADGTPTELTNSGKATNIIYYDVSLGYDVGYGIATGGKLYSWGDDTYGQSGHETTVGAYKDDWAYPTLIDFLKDKTVVSVAAGKQTSTEDKAFNSVNTLTGSAGSYSLNDAVKNDGGIPYITGALIADGSIVAWNKETRNTAENYQTLYYGSDTAVNDTDKFAAVYSGYGNHLFAVTTLGKLVHISYDDTKKEFVQDIYDDFVVAVMPMSGGKIDYSEKTGAGNFNTKDTNVGDNRIGDPVNIDYRKLTNWTKAADSDNPVIFTVDGEENEPELGDMIIYLDNLKVSQTTVELHENETKEDDVTSGLLYSGDRGSLVTVNGIGDVYRILDPDAGDVNFVKTTGTGGREKDTLTADDLKLKFKIIGSEDYMTDAQIGFMFDYDVVYSSKYGVGIKIDPKQSSQECWVTVEFYVARYDSRANFRITNEDPAAFGSATLTDNAIYYDYQPCSFRFKIDNTPAYRNHPAAFEGVEAIDDGNSYIPLLDPNNEYNNVYSVAVQDVSGGVEALADYLTKGGEKKGDFVGKLVEAMMLADRPDGMAEDNTSFPAISRIGKGNLEYYFGSEDNAKKYYSDKYQYLMKDRDADVLILTGSVEQTEINDANSGAVKPSRATITIKDFDISSYGVDADRVKALATDFNNKYGLYKIGITDDNKLTFSYEIIRFTAIGATGALNYSDNDISKFNTVKSGNAYEQINVTATEYSAYNATDYTLSYDKGATRNVPNAFAVFSQPSLRLKAQYSEDGVTKYGKKDVSGVTDTVIETISTLRVGEPWTKTLSDYVANVGAKSGNAGVKSASSAIYFSALAEVKNDKGEVIGYKESRTDFNKFNGGFHDETGSGENIVTLTADTITVKPTTAHPINFRVTIRRFHGSNNGEIFGDNEKITIIFNFVNIADFSMSLSGGKTSYSVDKKSSCDILGNGSAIENLINISPSDYRSRIKINPPRSSNTSVLTVEQKGNTTFDITPVSSGKAVVQVVASLYDKSVVITLEFSVSGLTTISDIVELIDTSYIYVNSLIGDLREANSFNTRINNYGVLFEDVNEETGMPNALYFTDKAGTPIDGYPSYIKEVRFTHYSDGSSNPRIALIFDSETRDTTGEYYLCVRYVDTTRGYTAYADVTDDTILVTKQLVRSAKHIVPGENGEAILTINANCDQSVSMDVSNPDDHWYTKGENTNMTIYIPVKMLMKDVSKTPEMFKIFLVTSSTDAANYFNYSFDSAGKNVLIHPLYDTPEPMMVNVSVRSTDATSSQSSQVVSFRIKTDGISTTLSKKQYTTIWLVAFFASFGVLFIIFLIRMIVYWRRRAKQRALIKRNQELIRMRDRVHNKASAASREQIVRSKMKMEDPKYAKLFNEMKKDKQATETNGVTLENMSSTPSETTDNKKAKKKKKGGKKSIAELKAELEAKKAAFAQAQNGDTAGAAPFAGGEPQQDFGASDMNFDPNQNFGSPADAFSAQDLDANSIIFDVVDDQGSQG